MGATCIPKLNSTLDVVPSFIAKQTVLQMFDSARECCLLFLLLLLLLDDGGGDSTKPLTAESSCIMASTNPPASTSAVEDTYPSGNCRITK